MKITKQFAKSFADKWVNAWNNRDIEGIMDHYIDSVVFSSPFILKAQINDKGTIHGKSELKKYFEKALENNSDLYFDLKHIMVGTKSITLIYTRKKTMLASEVMMLDGEGKVVEGLSHYPVDDIYELL
jgi:ketosteroid isomerase-like protein